MGQMNNKFVKILKQSFYNELFKVLKSYIIQNRTALKVSKTNLLENKYVTLDDFDVRRILASKSLGSRLYSVLQIVCSLEVNGYGRYGYETDNGEAWLNVHVSYRLDDGIKDFTVVRVEDSDNKLDFTSEFTDNFVPIISSSSMETIAERILEKHQPSMLEEPRSLDIPELITSLDIQLIEQRLSQDNSIFGEIVFKDMLIGVLDEDEAPCEIEVSKGTIVVDPTIKDFRNQGSYNNTVVHEIVHWILHRSYQECRMLLDGDARTSFVDSACELNVKWRDADWMEWHANGIAPRLLMPKKTTKQKVNDLFTEYSLKYPEDAKTNMFEQVIDDIAEFFQVSRLAAKIRLQQLGYKEFEGIYNFVGDQYLRSYSFELKALASNQTFTISFPNACLLNITNVKFRELMDSQRYVYVDSHFCLNNSKYVTMVEYGIYEMTDYAYEHMDECCLVFDIYYKHDRKKDISITIFNEYIMYRGKSSVEIEVDFSDFLSIVDGKVEIQDGKIFEELAEVIENLPSTFPKTLVYHRDRKALTQEELEEATGISVSTIRRLETKKDTSRSIEHLMALSLGMKLFPPLSFDLVDKSGTSFRDDFATHLAYKMVLSNMYHKGVQECNSWLIEMGIPGFLKKEEKK
ncbi:ImmA/IrrE family metallo-endopeptidase [Streptococcus suis]|uniref:ImmA/IrrE family metallo-endopeptidase n=1 Tax=Streptococcus suis TaxID=1307 RepID=UPI000CF7349A|nr:ImmA/IrrE family metallo-endopeptidase [Streptococcus suis]